MCVIIVYLLVTAIGHECVFLGQNSTVKFTSSDYNDTIQSHTKEIKFSKGVLAVDVPIESAPMTSAFFVFQVHSFMEEVYLSTSSNFASGTVVNGFNVGLVGFLNDPNLRFYVKTCGTNVVTLQSFTFYENDVPIPGGCNMVYPTKIAPYLKVIVNDNYLKVHAQAASLNNIPCENNSVSLSVYRLYLDEGILDEMSYYNGIHQMMTVRNIKKYGKEIYSEGQNSLKRIYSTYKGVGKVFAIIATYNGKSSAYVPIVTYGCDVTHWDEDCRLSANRQTRVLCVVLIFFGLCMWFLGHRFFDLVIITAGIIFGVFVTYTLATMEKPFTHTDQILYSTLFALFYFSIGCILWRRKGVKCVTYIVAPILLGTLLNSFLFYTILGDTAAFSTSFNYWSIYFSVTVCCLVLIYTLKKFMNFTVFICTLLGSSVFILSLSYVIDCSLHYIILNIIRRTTIDGFKYAIIDAPFQLSDVLLTLLWALLITVRMLCRVLPNKPWTGQRSLKFAKRFLPKSSVDGERARLLPNFLQYYDSD